MSGLKRDYCLGPAKSEEEMIPKHGEPLQGTSTKYLWQILILQGQAAVLAVVQLEEWIALNSAQSSDRRDGRDAVRLFTECGRWEAEAQTKTWDAQDNSEMQPGPKEVGPYQLWGVLHIKWVKPSETQSDPRAEAALGSGCGWTPPQITILPAWMSCDAMIST